MAFHIKNSSNSFSKKIQKVLVIVLILLIVIVCMLIRLNNIKKTEGEDRNDIFSSENQDNDSPEYNNIIIEDSQYESSDFNDNEDTADENKDLKDAVSEDFTTDTDPLIIGGNNSKQEDNNNDELVLPMDVF